MRKIFGLSVALITAFSLPVSADYVLVLKNGRQITVQSYRDEGKTIKFNSLGGVITLNKDQIQTIRKSGGDEGQETGLPTPTNPPSRSDDARQPASDSPQIKATEATDSIRADQTVEDAAVQELEKKLKEITDQLETAQRQYVDATQGGSGSASATPAGYRALTADLMSRLKEKRGAANSEYEPQEREIRDLRIAIDKLQTERDALVEELKSKSSTPESR
jgi:hypothetical protein